jgi:enolase-phosphatase E1
VLEQKWSERSFAPYRDAFPETARASPEALRARVEDLTRRDVKIAYLKNLQGYLWEDGYKSGAYATPLFPDVAPRLRSWKEDQGFHLAIYSSGSVFAQKLLFEHVDASRAGTEAEVKPDTVGEDDGHRGEVQDLTGLFDVDGWFDTTNAGLKTEVSSYATIAQALKVGGSLCSSYGNIRPNDRAVRAGYGTVSQRQCQRG